MKFYIKILIPLLMTGICSVSSYSQQENMPLNGFLDISNIEITQSTIFNLNGQWEFYWGSLIEPDEFNSSTPPSPNIFCKVPSLWSSYEIDGEKLDGHGHATYRLIILLPSEYRNEMSFHVPVFDVAFSLYLNGTYYGGNGKPGTSVENSEAEYSPFIINFIPDSDTLEILIHVSNYQHRRGGFWKTMNMGHPEAIEKQYKRNNLIDYIALGVLLAFTLFFLAFFIMFRQDRQMLFYALALAGIFLRIIAKGNYPVLLIYDLPWVWLIRIEYFGNFIALTFSFWYFQRVFPTKLTWHLARLNSLIIALILIIVLTFDVTIFAYSVLYFQFATVIFIVYYFIISLIHSIKRTANSLFYFSGITFLLLGIFNDIALANSRVFITKSYIFLFAILVFVFIQSIVLIKKWIATFYERERLSEAIKYININLESLVEERTMQLQTKNVMIKEKNIKIENQNKHLQDALDFKNRFFSIIAHDLRSPIASLLQLYELLDLEMDNQEKYKILSSARTLVKSASVLIDNLLFWGRSQGNQIKYQPSNEKILTIINKVSPLFAETVKQKSIDISYNCSENMQAYIDQELMQIVLRNLISNAIKFTSSNGKISVDVNISPVDSKELIISIKDTGVGMSKETIEKFFKEEEIISTRGTNDELGTGLGLRLCSDMIKINKGRMEIESSPGEGSVFTIFLPLSAK